MEYRNYKNNIYDRKRQYSGTFPHHPEMSAFGVDALLGPFLVPKKGGATDSDLKKNVTLLRNCAISRNFCFNNNNNNT